ncbi:MAG: LysM peptidoglycan-binding domain-containing protein [Cyclobacteriaceae bacterium]
MKLTAALFTCFSTWAIAQSPQVPHKMQFAGMTLTIRDDARREIQQDVDLLTRSPKHVAIKAERAKTYFPIIEKVFEEERVPDDLKYLVLQESALISDAVSVSNAVGFWQFKDFTAIEMGLRVDKQIDERMNIVSSTRAAAKYLKKNNTYFNNWLYALQAYQMGAGGVMKSVKDFQAGTKHMEITSKTYWYVKKFLAHKVAYEDAVNGAGEVKVITLVNQREKPLHELAREFALSEEELKEYNKWVRGGTIPGDKPYTVAIPTAGDGKGLPVAMASSGKSEPVTRVDAKPATAKNEKITINGIAAMQAQAGESISTFVRRADIDLSYFLKCNDLSISDKLTAGEFYYLKKKKARADVPQHVVKHNENLWRISQAYGVQVRKLEKYNGLKRNDVLKEGSVVFLSGRKSESPSMKFTEVAEVEQGETFSWSIQSESAVASIEPVPVIAFIDTTVSREDPTPIVSEETIIVRPEKHTVSTGETLYSIAKHYQLDVMDIVRWNNLKVEEGFKPGQVLQLQAVEVETTPHEIVHMVKPADTMYSVARQYGVTIKELMDWNQKKDFSLVAGENLKILKKQ